MDLQALRRENLRLKERLAETEETLRAIQQGEVDALVVTGPGGPQIYTLQGAEKPHRLLVESMNEGALTLSSEGTVLYCNRHLAEMVKRPLEHVMGSPWQRLLPAAEQPLFHALLAQAKESKEGRSKGESALRTGQGELVPVQVSVSVADLEGVQALSVLLTDISERKTAEQALRQAKEELELRVQERTASLLSEIAERKRVEEALRESQEQFRMVAENARAVFGIVQGKRFVYANPYLSEISGYSLEEILSMDFVKMVHPDFRQQVADYARRRLVGEAVPTHYEFAMLTKGGETRWMDFSPGRIEYHGRPAIVGTAYDVTARKLAEQAVAEAQKQLKQHAENLENTVQERTAKLNEMVGELEHFSYAITHDMRAPLRAISGFIQLLLSGQGGTCGQDSARSHLTRIKNAAERMDSLIRDALQYSKTLKEEFPLKPVDVKQLLVSLMQTYPNLQEAELFLEGEFPPVLGNEAAITQCFSNLLGNAVKFVPQDTTPRITVHAEARNDFVRVWVQDNGIGIAPQHQERIFKMFQKLHPEYEGTGIGLAIVKKSAERMGGRVGVESEPGKGSRFWIDLKATN